MSPPALNEDRLSVNMDTQSALDSAAPVRDPDLLANALSRDIKS